MKKIVFIIFIGFSSFLFFNCETDNSEININTKKTSSDSLRKINKLKRDSIILAGQKAIKEGKQVNLLNFYGKVLSTDTNNIDDYINYGYMLGIEGHASLGLKYIDRADKIDRNNSSIYFAKSMLWGFIENKKNYRDSLYYYLNKAIKYDSLNAYYWTARSMFYDEDSSYTNALSDINKAIELDARDTSLYLRRGSYKMALKDYEGALLDMKNISLNHQNDFAVYANRAYCYLKLKKYKECLREANRSIEINSSTAKLYGTRAAAKSKLNDFDGAYEDLEKGAKLGDKECQIYLEKYIEAYKNNKHI